MNLYVRSKLYLSCVLLTFVAAVLLDSKTVKADVVTDWNSVALDAIQIARTNPPRATRVLAMVHTAVYDAVNGIEGVYEPYAMEWPPSDRRGGPPIAPPGASPEAAAAVAAHRVLTSLYPDPELVAYFDLVLEDSLAAVPKGGAKKKGILWGRACADEILRLRTNDGSDEVVLHEPVDECGRWQPTPPDFLSPLLPAWAYVTPFAMFSPDQFRVQPPPDCMSLEYAVAFNEVKEIGAWDSITRTADQTEVAFYWEDGPGSVTPPGHWHVIAQKLAERFDNSLLDNARMFALLSIVQADAAISCWDSKYQYDYWRPVTGIPLADMDGNDLTEADMNWEPLLPTPPFPAYTSGHSTFSGSSAELLELFFDDRQIAFSASSPNPEIWPDFLFDDDGQPVVRSWSSLWEAAEEAGQSRIYGGIHWQYDNTEALEAGRELAQYVFMVLLQPRD